MKDIKGYKGIYAITRNCRVWSYSRIIRKKSRWGNIITYKWGGNWLKTNTTKDGKWYQSISFGHSKNKNRKGFKVHRLVAQAYIPNPLNLPEVNHKNGIKNDNRVENLEWCSRKQNLEHGFKINPISKRKYQRGSKNFWAKLTEKQVRKIKKECIFFKQGKSARAFAKKYGVSSPTIQGIINGIYWKHI